MNVTHHDMQQFKIKLFFLTFEYICFMPNRETVVCFQKIIWKLEETFVSNFLLNTLKISFNLIIFSYSVLLLSWVATAGTLPPLRAWATRGKGCIQFRFIHHTLKYCDNLFHSFRTELLVSFIQFRFIIQFRLIEIC